MKRCIILILMLLMSDPLMAQEAPYPFEERWAEIEKQENEGLLRSMLPAINEIYEAAKNENKPQQVIRALLYQSKIAVITDDDDDTQWNVIRNFEQEIESSEGPVRAILTSMLAETLYSYYQRNRWTIDQRTPTGEATTDDFRFWSENIFNRQITAHYLASLENPETLQHEQIQEWETILEKHDPEMLESGRELRPTIYDLLAHRAVDFFLDQPHIFFRSFEGTPDTRQNMTKARELLQNLILFHEGNGNQNATLYNKLRLLSSKKSEWNSEEHLSELKTLSETAPDAWYTSEILLELANAYLEQAGREPDGNYDEKKEWTERALDVAGEIVHVYPETHASAAAKNLKTQIHAKSFSIRTEQYLLPDRPNPVSITHKNLDKLFFKVLKYQPSVENFFSNPLEELQRARNTEKQQVLNRLFQTHPSVTEFSLSLKPFDDYQAHSTIAKFPPLGEGMYLVLVSNNPDFRVAEEEFILQSHLVHVSGTAIVTNVENILVTDRNSGQPIETAEVAVYRRQGNSLILHETTTTGPDGTALQPTIRDRSAQLFYRLENSDVFYSRRHYFPWNTQETTVQKTKFMTDRAIYRPGQTLYFKAIVYEEQPDGERHVVENRNTPVELRNANGQVINNLNLTTNEFGSISGEFVLPAGGLTGMYSLAHGDEIYRFSVEEYKRPRFEVTFEPVGETYRLDEEITARGQAAAYSGASIGNAAVSYRVYRQAVFPFLPWWQRGTVRAEPRQEIAFGESTTDSEGNFEITFHAIPANDQTDGEPRTYTYRIEADVTDINGETRSGSQSVTVGDRRLTLSFSLPERIEMNNFRKISVITQNLNGESVSARGEVTLTKLQPPGRVLRNSPLQPGDYQLYSRDEFTDYFPNEPYGAENNKENWIQDDPVWISSFNTEESDSVHVAPADEWKEGTYLLKGSLTDGEDIIETEQLVYLYRSAGDRPVDNELFSAITDRQSYQPGDTARVTFASSAPESVVFVELEHDGDIIKTELLQLDNNVRFFTFPVEKSYRGNVYVHYYFGKFNTARQATITIPVPYKNKELTITTNTFRDKLSPGNEETWELTITGPDAEPILAEMVAGMYDASLDAFRSNSIEFNPYRFTRHSPGRGWNTVMGFGTRNFSWIIAPQYPYETTEQWMFDRINWFGFSIHGRVDMRLRGTSSVSVTAQHSMPPPSSDKIEEVEIDIGADLDLGGATVDERTEEQATQVQPRRALQETAFFYPHLKTDEEGNVRIRFTTPESLTEWKFMAMAHTPGLKTANYEARAQTQKELMVVPNPPRFLRAGDELAFSSRITSLSEQELTGTARLQLFDAFTMQPVDADFGNQSNSRSFTLAPQGGTNVTWQLQVPEHYQAIIYRVVAAAGDYSDGEEAVLPVLTNRMMVTETLPIYVREGQEKTFTLEKLKENRSETLSHFRLTLEMTTQPVWYAIFSLPYLRENTYEGSEQIFSRYFGNVISRHIVNSNPKIRAVFDDWNRQGQLASPLEKNEELTSILLEETPWLRQAESETDQMKRIALLFDLNTMRNELAGTFQKLQQKQLPSGGFPWFDGGPENYFITAHIVSGFGYLKKMGMDLEADTRPLLENAIRYLDTEMEKHYRRTLDHDGQELSIHMSLQYLYARSFFMDEMPPGPNSPEIADYLLEKLEEEKFNRPLKNQTMLSLIFHRFGETETAETLLRSVKDHAVQSDEMGMYWNSNISGWRWYQAPVETQALLIEAFDEVLGDTESVESMKIWLLKNRQTNRWHSTKATSLAVFALLNTGKNWTDFEEEALQVRIGGEMIDIYALETSPQSGSGYIKTSWGRDAIRPEMAVAEVRKTSPGPAWGALYWQYFEDLDNITPAETGVRFNKELFLKKNTAEGPELHRITENTPLQVGDLVTVRLELQTDREMEFIHIKDMRAAGFEPVDVISSYRYQGGLGYYQSTRDAATHFFIDRMQRGVYLFEYDVRANSAGSFSNGITSLQNMYAPELSAHSEGIRIIIE